MNEKYNIQGSDYAAIFEEKGILTDQKPTPVNYSLSPTEKKVAALLQDTWNSYKATKDGSKKIADLKKSSIEEIQFGIKEIYQGPAFAKCVSSFLSMDLGSLKSVSLGLSGTVALGIGVVVGAGCIFDLKNLLNVEGYVSGGGLFGIDADAALGEEAGFWNCEYDNFGGKSFGVILAGEDVGGFSVGLFASSLNILSSITGFSIGLAEGVGIEISACVTYTVQMDPLDSLRSVYQFPKSHFLILTKLVCNHTSPDGAGDEDEVYFTFRADDDIEYYFPKTNYYSMKDSGEFDTWECGRSVWFNNSVEIIVYDQDDGSGDDVIGKGTINLNDLPTNGTEVSFDLLDEVDDESSYTMYAKLVQTT